MEIPGPASSFVVLDFETSGLSPAAGDRPIEVGAVRYVAGVPAETFHELMNPGFPVSAFIMQFTGITNDMLSVARPCSRVMADFADFLRDGPVVAHNASFDMRFLESEWSRLQKCRIPPYACSMLCARRIYPDAPNHKLGTLVSWRRIPDEEFHHRALSDALMTGRLWMFMLEDLRRTWDIEPDFAFMQKLMGIPSRHAQAFLARAREEQFRRDAAR